MEIEKKFLVTHIPDDLDQYPCHEIQQAYLCHHPIVRIRKWDDEYILTYKSRELFRKNYNISVPVDINAHEEVELPLNKEAYEHLLTKVDYHIITKKRYNIPLYGGLVAELDVFSGQLEGLIIVEVEFSSADQAASFVKPDWFDTDVTSNKLYGNAGLSKLERWEKQ